MDYSEHFQDNSSALKIEISRYLTKAEELLEEINLLKKVNIDGIITTNWDQFLEHLFPKFTKFVDQDGLITGRSHGIAEIYKIHGCIDKPNSL